MTDDFQREVRRLESAVGAARQAGDKYAEGESLRELGKYYMYKSGIYYEQATILFNQALTIAQEIRDQRLEIKCLLQWGVALRYQDKNDNAMRIFSEALALSREIGDKSTEAESMVELGDISDYYLDNYPQAVRYYREAANILSKNAESDKSALILTAFTRLAQLYVTGKEYQQAIHYYEQALTIICQYDSQYREISSNQKYIKNEIDKLRARIASED